LGLFYATPRENFMTEFFRALTIEAQRGQLPRLPIKQLA
jgi:hypothetical protein